MLEKFSVDDAECNEICSWFPTVKAMVEHAGQVLVGARMDEIYRIIPDRLEGVTCMGVFIWAMREAMESPHPRQRARWYSYRSRRYPPDPAVKAELAAIPTTRKTVICGAWF